MLNHHVFIMFSSYFHHLFIMFSSCFIFMFCIDVFVVLESIMLFHPIIITIFIDPDIFPPPVHLEGFPWSSASRAALRVCQARMVSASQRRAKWQIEPKTKVHLNKNIELLFFSFQFGRTYHQMVEKCWPKTAEFSRGDAAELWFWQLSWLRQRTLFLRLSAQKAVVPGKSHLGDLHVNVHRAGHHFSTPLFWYFERRCFEHRCWWDWADWFAAATFGDRKTALCAQDESLTHVLVAHPEMWQHLLQHSEQHAWSMPESWECEHGWWTLRRVLVGQYFDGMPWDVWWKIHILPLASSSSLVNREVQPT